MTLGVESDHTCSDRAEEGDELILQHSVSLVRNDRRDEPHRTLKQVGVGMLDAAELLAGHRMPRQHTLPCLVAVDHASALDQLLLSAAGVADQGRRWQRWG